METVISILYGACFIALIVGLWKVFEKAGKPGWAAIIPIYNIIVFIEIIGKKWYWIFILFIPLVNLVFLVIGLNMLSKVFGKGIGFTIGLFIIALVFFIIIGFGNAQYTKPS